MIAAGIFITVAVVLCVAAVLALLGTAQVHLSGPAAIEHDGLAPGRSAPRWSRLDAAGVQRHSPAAGPLQLILFADHALKSFPSVVDGLRELIAREPELDVIVLLRGPNELAAPLLRMLGLDVPVVTGTPALYARYNVRVGPFIVLVDAAGQVRASSLVNYDWQIAKLHQLATIPVDFPKRSADRRLRRSADRRLRRSAAEAA
jgi:hypothetical protein